MASTPTQFDSDCKLMLHCEGADGSSTFTDSSFSNTKIVTANSLAQINTGQLKFGTASGFLNRGSGATISVPNGVDFQLGTMDWTFDWWSRFNTTNNSANFFGKSVTGDIAYTSLLRNVGTTFTFRHSTNGLTFKGYDWLWSPGTATWYHVAFIRSSTSLLFFVDGTQVGTSGLIGTENIYASTGLFAFGATNLETTPANIYDGYFDEFRFVNGTAIWTSDFTPPVAAYTSLAYVARTGGLPFQMYYQSQD